MEWSKKKFWILNFSKFSIRNLINSFISQSNTILTFIFIINHTAKVSIYLLRYNVLRKAFAFHRSFLRFFLDCDDRNKAKASCYKKKPWESIKLLESRVFSIEAYNQRNGSLRLMNVISIHENNFMQIRPSKLILSKYYPSCMQNRQD